MTRRPVFDPTNRELFVDQRQQFDWSLLQNGQVFRYDNGFELDSACIRLADLGYLVHRIDGSRWTSADDMHTAFATAMSFPSYYGRNLDALSDVLSDVAAYSYGSDPGTTGTVLAIAGYDTLVQIDPRTARLVLDCFTRQARLAGLYAHPMLCLIESTGTDLGPVGGLDVCRGSVWDVAPDPPDPFDDADIVEFMIQIYLSDAGAAEYVAALRPVLADFLADVGRWQILGVTSASERTAQARAKFRGEPPPAGTRLMEVFIGVRGAGDFTVIGDGLVHAIHRPDIRFEQMASRVFRGGSEARDEALSRYCELRDSGI
uniref:barstar family protein n=1 Tax=Rhodococcus oryzae TaxID=2571143 RepID=UPI001FE3A782|nr:barstar family protein [Rhodococcus oryzae]